MAGADKPMSHVFLVDGAGFMFRAFHALPPMTRPDGTPVNAVYGFTRMLMKLLAGTDADHVAVVFDRGRRTFRNDIYPEYKAHRPELPEEMVPQIPLMHEATRALNVAEVGMDGYEADDLIATYTRLAREAGARVTIVSSDKDMMQLVGPGVEMYDAMKDRTIGAKEVEEKFGVGPDRVVDVQALAGDSSDNVPGVAGIGVKTAAELIRAYGDLESVLARADEIKQPKRRQALLEQAEQARMSRKLVQLDARVPVEWPLASFAVRKPDPEALVGFLRAQAFRSLIVEVEKLAGAAGAGRETPAPATEPKGKAAADYELVRTAEALGRWIEEARAAGTVAVDTETTSLDAMRAELVGVSLSASDGRACYVPLGHKAAEANLLDVPAAGDLKQIPLADALALLKPLFEDASVLKVGQNLKYDMCVLARHGLEVRPFDDTMLISYVLDAGLHGHGMDELAALHLAHKTIAYGEVTKTGKTQVTFDRVPLEKALAYAAEDADVTLRLYRALKPRLVADRLVSVYETLERPLVPVLLAMERAGVRVDAAALRALSEELRKRLALIEKEVHRLAGRAFNVGSPKQLGEVLFDEMSLAGGRKGKTGAYATGADILEALAAEGHALPARVLEWRQLAKLKSTYTDALPGQVNPETGRVHTSYGQAIASTGRLSSTDPNLQNIPVRTEEGRKIRQAFVADKGWRLLSADYSQIELRLLAHVAGIDALKEAFLAGEDIHATTAAQVFGVPKTGMDPQVRRKAKAINFGIIYGISAFGLARQLGIGNREAADYIDAYFKRYPGIRDYMERTKAEAKRRGYVTTLYGRRVHVRDINSKNPNVRGFAERAAINAPIQGGAADVIKRAMIQIPDALDRAKLKARMLMQVHDELVFEVPADEVENTAAVVKKTMEGAARLSIPLVVDTGSGANWDEAH